MFHRSRKTTLREAARGRGAVVDSSQTVLYSGMGPISEPFEYKRTIRVTFPDGSTNETQQSISLDQVQRFADRRTIDCWSRLAERTKIAAVVPVRYDEWDHSRIVMDVPALVEEILTALDGSANGPFP
jgi:hypothetical protein